MANETLSSDELSRAILRLLDQQRQLGPPEQSPARGRFSTAGLLVGLLGFDDSAAELVGSAYLRELHGRSEPARPPSELTMERGQLVAQCCADLQRQELCVSAQPVAAGGLLLALASCCLDADSQPAVGCAVVLPAPRQVGAADAPSVEQQLFHEAPGRILICIPAHRQADARLFASEQGIPLWPLGRTGGRELVIRASDGETSFREVLRLPLATLNYRQPPPGQPPPGQPPPH